MKKITLFLVLLLGTQFCVAEETQVECRIAIQNDDRFIQFELLNNSNNYCYSTHSIYLFVDKYLKLYKEKEKDERLESSIFQNGFHYNDIRVSRSFFAMFSSIKDSTYSFRSINYESNNYRRGKQMRTNEGELMGRCHYLCQNPEWENIKSASHLSDTLIVSTLCSTEEVIQDWSNGESKDLLSISIDSSMIHANKLFEKTIFQKNFYIKQIRDSDYMRRTIPYLLESSQPIKPSVFEKCYHLANAKEHGRILDEDKEYAKIFAAKKTKKTDGTDIANIPILLVDEKNHKNRADSEDWRIYTHINPNNGDFFQYFFFETELDQVWPLYIRDFAMDHLAGAHVCKNSTVAVLHRSKEKVVQRGKGGFASRNVYIPRIKGKEFRPDPVPKDKNTIPKDRLFFNEEYGRIFGSHAKIWDLKIWSSMPELLRKSPKGVYLVGYGTLLQLNECKTPESEQALLKKCAIFITPTLYKQLQSLRRHQEAQLKTEKK